MDVVKLGKKGQVSIPKGVLTQLGLEGERLLLVEGVWEIPPTYGRVGGEW